MIDQIAANYNIHGLVVTRAREEFARYRDVREKVQQFEGVVAACVLIAYIEVMNSLGVEAVQVKKITYLKESSSASNNLDHGSDSSHRVPVDNDDVALTLLPEKIIGKWDINEIREWLVAMGKEYNKEATVIPVTMEELNTWTDTIISHIQGNNHSNGSQKDVPSASENNKKRKYPVASSCFGSTTAAHRYKRISEELDKHPISGIKVDGSLANSDNHSTVIAPPGQRLCNLDMGEHGLVAPAYLAYIRKAVGRRLTYEGLRSAALHEAELESKRLYTERLKSAVHVTSMHELTKPKNAGIGTNNVPGIVKAEPVSIISTSNVSNPILNNSVKAEVLDIDSLFDMKAPVELKEVPKPDAALQAIKLEPGTEPESAIGTGSSNAELVNPNKKRFKIVRAKSNDDGIIKTTPTPGVNSSSSGGAQLAPAITGSHENRLHPSTSAPSIPAMTGMYGVHLMNPGNMQSHPQPHSQPHASYANPVVHQQLQQVQRQQPTQSPYITNPMYPPNNHQALLSRNQMPMQMQYTKEATAAAMHRNINPNINMNYAPNVGSATQLSGVGNRNMLGNPNYNSANINTMNNISNVNSVKGFNTTNGLAKQ